MPNIARGSWQRQCLIDMLSHCGCDSPRRQLRGRAQRYADKYIASFHAMLARARRYGYIVERTPGPRGSEWGATYRLTERPR